MAKEHGFLFKGEMVQSLMKPVDPKRHTRRPITFDNSNTRPHITRKQWPELQWDMAVLGYDQGVPFWYVPRPNSPVITVSPRVQPGDIIWVREMWTISQRKTDGYIVTYREDWDSGPPLTSNRFINRSDSSALDMEQADRYFNKPGAWRPGIHMPRWASRIDLYVNQMLSQRVQEISGEDAIKEGVDHSGNLQPLILLLSTQRQAINRFHFLWDSINAERGYSWVDNHPVWIYDFKRQEAQNGQ